MWTRRCLYACAIIVLQINLHEISANENTHYLPPLECYDPYGRPQVSIISISDHYTPRVLDFFVFATLIFVHSILIVFLRRPPAIGALTFELNATQAQIQHIFSFSFPFQMPARRESRNVPFTLKFRTSHTIHNTFEVQWYLSYRNSINRTIHNIRFVRCSLLVAEPYQSRSGQQVISSLSHTLFPLNSEFQVRKHNCSLCTAYAMTADRKPRTVLI